MFFYTHVCGSIKGFSGKQLLSNSTPSVVTEVSPDYPHISLNLTYFENEFKDIEHVIQDGRNTIKRTQFGMTNVVIKSFKKPGKIQGFIYRFFRKSKARRSYEYGLELLRKDICTPKPVAFIEVFNKSQLLQSYYISEFFTYDFRIRDVVENNVPNKEAILKKFVSFTYNMHQQHILHLDHSTGNTLIKQKGDGYEFCVVDINRLKFGKVSKKKGVSNLNKVSHDPQTVNTLADTYAIYADLPSDLSREWLNSAIRGYLLYLERKQKLKQLVKNIRSK